MATANTIVANRYGTACYEELPAAEAILPGTGVVITTDAEGNETLAPVSASGVGEPRFAREQRNPPRAMIGGGGMGLSPIEQQYEAGNNVESELFGSGDKIRARIAAGGDLDTPANANVEAGDPLNFASDGSLKVTDGRASAVAVAREDNDNSDAAAGENPVALVQVV
jgi:hypothetical protein